jgi:hypothetical protein
MSACLPCPDDDCACDRGTHRYGRCSNADTGHTWGLSSAQQTGSKPQKGKEMARVAIAARPLKSSVGYVGRDHPETAHAMERKALGQAGTLRFFIWNLLNDFGPLTDDEMEQVLERSHQSVSGSRRTLVIDGWVRDSGRKKLNRYQNEAIMWEAISGG